jgi:hypothetical protein
MSIFGYRAHQREQTTSYDELTAKKRVALAKNTNALAELKVAAALDSLTETFKGASGNG